MTGDCSPDAQKLVAFADRAEEARSNPERGEGGYHPASSIELSAGTVSSTAISPQTSVQRAGCVCDTSVKDFADLTPDRALIGTSRIPTAAGEGAHSIPGLQVAAETCTATFSGDFGVYGQ